MTNKTKQEKIDKINELVKPKFPLFYSAEEWLKQAEISGEKIFLYWDKSHREIPQAVWDVHTGVAFTKLYRSLK